MIKKFRAWDKHKKLWEDRLFAISKDGIFLLYNSLSGHWVEPDHKGYVVEQFTGFCNKNGKEIWEDDICTAEYICEVSFDSAPHLLTGTIEQADNGLWMFDYGHGELPLDLEDLEITEIIGNAHEDPNLLEAKC